MNDISVSHVSKAEKKETETFPEEQRGEIVDTVETYTFSKMSQKKAK